MLVGSTRWLSSRPIGDQDHRGIPVAVAVARGGLHEPLDLGLGAGEGTGLGLSISHDIIVTQHAGSIEVDTQPGEFTEFRIILPRTGVALIKS